jgi:hypothetical protein
MKRPIYLDIDMDYFVKPVFKYSVNGMRLYKNEECLLDDVGIFFEKLNDKISMPVEKHIFTNHKKSYIYWWMKKLKNCILVHIDAHSDLYRNKQKDLRFISDIDMNCDDYLWFALRDDFIDEIYWVCPEDTIYLSDRNSAMNIIGPGMVNNMELVGDIVNIDFEVINRSGTEKKIKLHVLTIDNLPELKNSTAMLTMATSPEFVPSAADKLIGEINTYLNFSADNIEYVKRMHENMLKAADK